MAARGLIEVEDLYTRITRTEFSPCRQWRYWWEAQWSDELPPLVMCSLNPSKADEAQGDPTVARGVRRAQMMGKGRYIQLNAFAWRDTDPQALYGRDDPRALVGELNDGFIAKAAEIVAETPGALFMVGWGTHVEKVLPGRQAEIMALLDAAGIIPLALKVNKDGSPKHPLYCGYRDAAVAWELPPPVEPKVKGGSRVKGKGKP